MSEVKFGHKFHPNHPMIDGRDVVLAKDFDALQRQFATMTADRDAEKRMKASARMQRDKMTKTLRKVELRLDSNLGDERLMGEGSMTFLLDECREAIAKAEEPACDHEWVDARNAVIASGEICAKMCGAVRAGNAVSEVDEAAERAACTIAWEKAGLGAACMAGFWYGWLACARLKAGVSQ